MAWFLAPKPLPTPERPAAPARLEIPIFPINALLFPEGRLGLKIFEQRYLDMASVSLRDRSPFGICLIADGREVGAPAVPHPVGTLADIESWDMPQLGILMVSLRGGRRFTIRQQHVGANGLVRAEVDLLDETAKTAIPVAQRGLVDLLRQIANDAGAERIPPPHRFDDAEWVGHRLTEVLPVKLLAKQKLLELEDPLARLEILHAFLAQRGLVRKG